MKQTLLLLVGFTTLQFIFLTGGAYLLWFRDANMSMKRASLKALLMLLGSATMLVGVVLMAGGGYLLWFNAATQDDEDYLTTGSLRFASRRAFAITASPANVEIDLIGRLSNQLSDWWYDPVPFAIRSLKSSNSVAVSSSDPSKEIFIGIAPRSDVETYLADVEHELLARFDINPFDDHRTRFAPIRRQGRSEPAPPSSLSIWESSMHGPGIQKFKWDSSPGPWVVVIMNGDGSPRIDVNLTLGAKVPFVFYLGLAIMIGAFTALIGGAATGYSAFRV